MGPAPTPKCISDRLSERALVDAYLQKEGAFGRLVYQKPESLKLGNNFWLLSNRDTPRPLPNTVPFPSRPT